MVVNRDMRKGYICSVDTDCPDDKNFLYYIRENIIKFNEKHELTNTTGKVIINNGDVFIRYYHNGEEI